MAQRTMREMYLDMAKGIEPESLLTMTEIIQDVLALAFEYRVRIQDSHPFQGFAVREGISGNLLYGLRNRNFFNGFRESEAHPAY